MRSILLFIFLMIPFVFAIQDMTVFPSSISDTFLKDTTKTVQLQITNTGDITLWNISLKNTPSPIIENLSQNQTVLYNLSRTYTSLGTQVNNFLVQAYTKGIESKTPTTYIVNMTATSLNQPTSNAITTDIFIVQNSDTITHILEVNGTNYSIAPSGSQVLQFNNVGTHIIVDKTTLATNTYQIVTHLKDVFYYDPSKDKAFTITANVIYGNASYNITVLTPSFLVEANQKKDGVLQIDVGNRTLYNILFSGEWFSFNENNITLQAGETKFLPFSVKPMVATTNDTNKSYTKTLKIRPENAEEQLLSFNITLPFSAIIQNTSDCQDTEAYFNNLRIFCLEFPNAIQCKGPEPIIIRENISTEHYIPINFTMTAENALKLNELLASLDQRQQRFENGQNEKFVDIERICAQETLPLLKNNTDLLQQIQQNTGFYADEVQALKSQEDTQRLKGWVYWVAGIMIILILLVMYVFRRYKELNPTYPELAKAYT